MDKELPLIISEMLIKQDETTAQVKEVVNQLNNVVTHLNNVTTQVNELTTQVNIISNDLKETNHILRDFMGVSVKQWEQQQIFNEVIVTELKGIKGVLTTFAQLETRLKAVEDRESKFESRLATVERMLKAS